MDDQDIDRFLVTLTADIVAAHVTNNSVSIGDLPQLIAGVHGALSTLSSAGEVPVARVEPSVSVRASVKPDYIVCLEDGKRMKLLKRHLRTDHDTTPDEYRQKWGLNSDYPMVAPNYAEHRRTLANSIGLGTQKRKRKKAK